MCQYATNSSIRCQQGLRGLLCHSTDTWLYVVIKPALAAAAADTTLGRFTHWFLACFDRRRQMSPSPSPPPQLSEGIKRWQVMVITNVNTHMAWWRVDAGNTSGSVVMWDANSWRHVACQWVADCGVTCTWMTYSAVNIIGCTRYIHHVIIRG